MSKSVIATGLGFNVTGKRIRVNYYVFPVHDQYILAKKGKHILEKIQISASMATKDWG